MTKDDLIREIDRWIKSIANMAHVPFMTNYTGTIFKMRYYTTPQSKYKFTRANWYVAEFDIKDYTDVVHWCREQFGPHPWNPDAWSRWEHRYENKIHFRDEKDYAWFVLRWS
jgi:hypothetical protein